MTGRPAAGKSTLALAAEGLLLKAGRLACVLDGDELRRGLNRDLGFTPEDRAENLRRIAEMARVLADAGVLVVVAVIAPLARHREQAREIIGPARFIEVYVCADLATCERRDPKGHYRRARAGQLPDFTGITAPYEPPAAAGLLLETATEAVDAGARKIADALLALASQRS